MIEIPMAPTTLYALNLYGKSIGRMDYIPDHGRWGDTWFVQLRGRPPQRFTTKLGALFCMALAGAESFEVPVRVRK